MIITLVKADFSAKNIGVVGSYAVLTDLSAGLEYNGPTIITYRQPLEAIISVKKKYILMPETVVVTMKGKPVVDGIVATTESISINIPIVNGDISIVALAYKEGTNYNVADMWVRQNISGSGSIVTENISQSNIMPRSKFLGTASFTSLTIPMQMCLVTYNDNGTFKARGSWDKFGVGETITYTDANPFSVSIATSQVNTAYTVEEMVSMLHIEGTSVDANAIIYSDDVELWVRQNMGPNGQLILPDGTGGVYDRSNIMFKETVSGPITISNTNGPSLMIAQVTYNADGTFAARSSWTTVSVGNSVTYTSDYPFNIIICTSSKSEYSAEEVLAFVDVRCQG